MSTSTAKVTYSPNPFQPRLGQTQQVITCDAHTIADVLREAGVDIDNRSVFVQVNGVPLARDKWSQQLNQGDAIHVTAAPENGSNVIATILTIAVMVYAPYLAGVTTGLKAGTVGFKIASAVIAVGGAALVNAIFPPKLPKADGGSSPTYSLTGTQNQMRPYQPLPIVYGVHRIVPDLGAQPYSELVGQDSYLNQVFNFGLSDIDLSDIKIGDTLITTFQDVVVEESDHTGRLTLFPSNVDTESGGELKQADGWVTRTTSADCVAIGIDIEGTLFRTTKKGKFREQEVVLQIEYRSVGAPDWSLFMEYDPARKETERFGRHVVETPISPKSTIIKNGSQAPVRENFYRTVPKGQYEVRVKRITQDFDPKETKKQASLTWTQLRSYQEDDGNYYGQKRMAIRIRANGQINGTVNALNAIASAKVFVYDGDVWAKAVSRNPAWQLLDLLRGKFDDNDRLLYGGGIPDEHIDIESIVEFAAWCEFKDLKCDIVFDQPMLMIEMANTLARCGRGRVSTATGKYGVIWEEANKPVTQVFGMANIKAGSFRREYLTEDLADEVQLAFPNRDKNWIQDTVRVVMPGVTNPVNSTTIEVPGVTTVDQAAREANLQVAKNYYFNSTTIFETDLEGARCSIGDVIRVSHDLSMWGSSGRLIAGTDSVLTLDQAVEFEEGETPYILIRHPSGLIETREVFPQEEDSDVITLVAPLGADPSADADNDVRDYIWQFNPVQTPGKKLRVIDTEFLDENAVRLTCIDELPEYYDAEDGDFEYVEPWIVTAGYPEVLDVTITEQVVDYGSEQARVFVNWKLKNSIGARVRVMRLGEQWEDMGAFFGAQMSFIVAEPTLVTIEVTPIAVVPTLPGYGIVTKTYEVKSIGGLPEDTPAEVPRVSGLELFGDDGSQLFTNRDAKFVWRKVASGAQEIGSELNGADSGGEDSYFQDYIVQVIDLDGDVRRTEYVKDNSYTYTYEKNLEDGDVARTFAVEVRVRGTRNQVSDKPARLVVSNPAPSVPGGISFTPGLRLALVNYNLPNATDFAGVHIWVHTSSGFIPGPANLKSTSNSNTALIADLVSGQTYYARLAAFDTFGDEDLNVSSEFAFTCPIIETAELDPALTGEITDLRTDLAQEVVDRADAILAEAAARGTAIASEATLRETADEALAEQIDTLSATVETEVEGAITDLTAAIASEASARASGDSANASNLTALASTVSSNHSSVTSAIASEASTRSSADSSLAADITSLTSTVTTNNSTLTASLSTEATTRANADSALSSSLSTLSSTVGGHTTSISTNTSSINGIEAKYTVKIDNNGYIAGYGLISTANNGTPTSQFQVRADTFAVFNGSSPVSVFTVSGGTIYLSNAVANNLAANSVTSTQIAAGAVTAGKISVSSLDSITATIGLLRTAASGARMELESNQLRAYDSAGTLRARFGVW